MGNLTGILPQSWQDKAAKDLAPRPVEEQITLAMADAGIQAPDYFDIDGEIHRFKTDGKDKSGWYIFYPDNIVAGSFGDWRSGVELNFCANVGREITATEMQEQKRRIALAREAREIERQKQHKEVSESVKEIWDKAQPASADHLYLAKKGIQTHGARVGGDGRLIVPLFDEGNQISSLQYISHDSSKLYHKGGKTAGCFYVMGTPTDKVFIAEGFATAASIFETTGTATIVAYSASNIVKVSEIVSKHIKDITIIADNDKSGVGQKYADQASAKFGCKVIIPPTHGDANDYLQGGGDLKALLEPQKENDWLVSAEDFMTGFQPIQWLVKGVIPKSSSIMLFGPSGVGKSFLLLDWMMSVATGKETWQGKKVRPGHVVYLAGEGHHGIKGRIKAWLQEFGEGVDNIKLHISKSSCDLNTDSGIQQTLRELAALPERPVMIVIDTVNRFLDGDENSSQDVRDMMNKCDLIRQAYPESSNILVHHTGVSQEAQKRARGSSAWRGAMEVELCLSSSGDTVTMEQTKAKDGRKMDDFHFELKEIELEGLHDEDGEAVTSAVIKHATPPKKVEKDTKKEKNLQLLKKAWQLGGCEIIDEKPYISRSCFVRYCESIGDSPASAKQKAKASAPGRPINLLLMSGVIDQEANGFVLLDNVNASAWMMSNKCQK